MALPEFVTPVIAVAGAPALAYAGARSLWHVARALVVLVASVVAIRTDDDKRRTACLALVDKVTRGGGQPTGPAAPEQPPDGYGVPSAEGPE